MKAVRCLVILFVLVTLPFNAFAQDIGRAKDGRAYRKSADGFKIKDHIAELEVQVDGLQRQVYALEDELRDKNATISRLTGGKGIQKTEVKEADIVPFTGSRESAGPCDGLQAKINSLELTLKRVNQLGGTGAVIEEEQRRASLCERNLIAAKQNLASTESELLAMRGQVTRLQTALMEGPSEKTLENQEMASRQVKARLQQTQAELAKKAQEDNRHQETIVSLQESVEVARKALEAEKNKTSALEKEISETREQLAALESNQASIKRGSTRASLPTRASFEPRGSAKTTKATKAEPSSVITNASIQQSKSNLKQQLASVQSLIIKRKNVLDASKKSNKAVGIKVQPLRTKSGKSLDSIRVDVRKLSDPGQQFQLDKEIAEIKKVLEQDIAVLSRLSKL